LGVTCDRKYFAVGFMKIFARKQGRDGPPNFAAETGFAADEGLLAHRGTNNWKCIPGHPTAAVPRSPVTVTPNHFSMLQLRLSFVVDILLLLIPI